MNEQSTQPLLRRLIGVNELARELKISHHTVYSWVSQRRIPFLKVGRLLRFDRNLIETWLRNQAAPEIPIEDDPRPALDRSRCGTRPERRS